MFPISASIPSGFIPALSDFVNKIPSLVIPQVKTPAIRVKIICGVRNQMIAVSRLSHLSGEPSDLK